MVHQPFKPPLHQTLEARGLPVLTPALSSTPPTANKSYKTPWLGLKIATSDRRLSGLSGPNR